MAAISWPENLLEKVHFGVMHGQIREARVKIRLCPEQILTSSSLEREKQIC